MSTVGMDTSSWMRQNSEGDVIVARNLSEDKEGED